MEEPTRTSAPLHTMTEATQAPRVLLTCARCTKEKGRGKDRIAGSQRALASMPTYESSQPSAPVWRPKHAPVRTHTHGWPHSRNTHTHTCEEHPPARMAALPETTHPIRCRLPTPPGKQLTPSHTRDTPHAPHNHRSAHTVHSAEESARSPALRTEPATSAVLAKVQCVRLGAPPTAAINL